MPSSSQARDIHSCAFIFSPPFFISWPPLVDFLISDPRFLHSSNMLDLRREIKEEQEKTKGRIKKHTRDLDAACKAEVRHLH
jgi:hypothetical protein